MKSAGVSEVGSMEGQLVSKERGWKELQTLRVRQLESSLQKAQEECSSLREKYQQLREDFQFNLAILDERDRELERYDAITANALAVENKRQEELSHLCMQVAKLEEQRATEAEEWQKELSKSQHEAAQYSLQLDDVKHSVAGEMQKQTQEYERTKWDLERKIQGLEEKLNLQRQEMTAAFDTELRQREHELNLKTDEMHAVLLSHNLKVKLLSKSTEIYYQAYVQTKESLKACKECCLQIQRQLDHRDQDVENLTAVKDNRIKDLEDKLKLMETKLKKEEEDQHIQKYIRDVSTEMITLQERETKLKIELERSLEAIDRYKQQLSDGLKRERALEQMQVQTELEWQRRCEDIKARHYLATEQLIQDLTQARDQAKAELKEKKQELHDLTVLLHSVQTERDQAKQDSSSKPECPPSEEIRHLQEQNSILRAAVTQMRKDMESLSHLNQTPGTCAAPAFQVMTGSPTTNTSSNVSPADSQFIKTHPDTCGSTKEKVRDAHTESTLTNVIEQNTLVQKLQEDKPLNQQHVSGQNSQRSKGNHALMRSRLKQAASCIARLCQEKQQLIEMANRLRAQITATGLQELVEPEKDSSPQKQEDQHDQLSSLLGQLQYQLTTQELQYALRQRVCTVNEQLLPGTSNHRPSTNGAATSCRQGHNTSDRSEDKEKSSLVCLSQNSLNIHPNSGLPRSQLSSESMQSLKELWETLDVRLSSSIVSEGDDELSCRDMAKSDSAGVQMVVHGFTVPIHRPNSAEAKPKMNPSKPLASSTKISKPGAPGRIGKIRNYNVKD